MPDSNKLFGEFCRKVHPKLRMVANADDTVNTRRSELSCSVRIRPDALKEQLRMVSDYALNPSKLDYAEWENKAAGRQKVNELSDNVLVNVFVETNGRSSTAKEVSLAELNGLVERSEVSFVELAEPLAVPRPVVTAATSAPKPRPAWWQELEKEHKGGAGVLIGIIDVQGFDFAHQEFTIQKNGRTTTRFVKIWDQEGGTRPSPAANHPDDPRFAALDYGSELTQKQLNKALAASPKFRVAATDLEPQAGQRAGSHATHVASIAAGNECGLCPKAKIAGVLISLPEEDEDPRRSFFDSSRVAHAVDYLVALASDLKLRLVINVSLGTNGHAHDGTSAVNRWIDAHMSVPGRCICVSAGNAGQESAAFDGDRGFVTGRIHTSGRVHGSGLSNDIEWIVAGNGIMDISENELEIWYGAQDRFAVSVRPPGGDWIGPVEPCQFIENEIVPKACVLSVYNEVYHPSNGSNYISVFLSPVLSDPPVGIASGKWTVRVHGREIRDGRYHGWIERDDPRPEGRVGSVETWNFPSFFSAKSMVDDSSVSSLACGMRVISVANLDDAAELISITSSQGPTRDGRCKPDVAAPGTRILAANGFADPEEPYIAMSGTSMASPYVAGVAGLMLAAEPKLTAAQIEGILQRTSRPLPGASFTWSNQAGFGRIDPAQCVREAPMIQKRTPFGEAK